MKERNCFPLAKFIRLVVNRKRKKFYVYTKNKKLQNTFKNFRSAQLKCETFRIFIFRSEWYIFGKRSGIYHQ